MTLAFWNEIYRFVRARGFAHHDAEDLTQETWAKLLRTELPQGVTLLEPSRPGRVYGLRVARSVIVDHVRRVSAAKRQRFGEDLPLASEETKRVESAAAMEPDREVRLQEQWRVWVGELARLQQETLGGGRARLFQSVCQELLTGDRAENLEGLAKAAGISVSAAKVQTCRWRKQLAARFEASWNRLERVV